MRPEIPNFYANGGGLLRTCITSANFSCRAVLEVVVILEFGSEETPESVDLYCSHKHSSQVDSYVLIPTGRVAARSTQLLH